MDKNKLTVRELEQKDIKLIANYWFDANEDYLKGMGVDIARLPERSQFELLLEQQLELPYELKKAYALIWEEDGVAIGHCNVNPFVYGVDAFMHLHLWQPDERKKGYGTQLVKMSVPCFFNNLKIKKLFCEPYAGNEAPNKTLEKCGFIFVKEYVTTPGAITFEQPVKQWVMERQ